MGTLPQAQVTWKYQQGCLDEKFIYCPLLLLQADGCGETVVASVGLACDKAIPSWIILAEQPDLQEAMTKDGPLSSCHPLQHTVHG